MSQDKNARRIRRDKARQQMKHQLRIVHFYYPLGAPGYQAKAQGQWRKQNALNCGRSGCCMCCNPRRIFKAVTIDEQRADQAHQQELKALRYGD